MPLLTLAVLGLMLLGTVLGSPKPAPSQEPVATTAPQTTPVALTPELSAPMFHGVVQAIDGHALRVTIRTDFGRLVPVAVESCDLIRGLQIGDRVRLAVDAQGTVYALETTGAPPSPAQDRPVSSDRQPAPCQETTAT